MSANAVNFLPEQVVGATSRTLPIRIVVPVITESQILSCKKAFTRDIEVKIPHQGFRRIARLDTVLDIAEKVARQALKHLVIVNGKLCVKVSEPVIFIRNMHYDVPG